MFFRIKIGSYHVILVLALILLQITGFSQIVMDSSLLINTLTDTTSTNDSITGINLQQNDTINSLSLDNDTKQNIIPDSVLSPTDSLIVRYFTGNIENYKLNNYNYIDTGTYKFQEFNPLNKDNGMYSTLSNIGLAAKNLVYTPATPSGYFLGSTSFNKYLFHNKDVRYYKPYIPYTELNYVMGSHREQNFGVIFTRQLFRGFTFGLNYSLNYSPSNDSPYLRSGVNEQRVFFTAQYYTQNKRYGIIANYLRNNLKVEENGGIVNNSYFENNTESDRRLIPVNLMQAQNTIKQSGFYIDQYFNILTPTSNKNAIKRKIDLGNVSYSFRYRRNQMLYKDGNSLTDFYIGHSAPIDSASTYDSLYQQEIKNTIKWSNIGYNKDPQDKIFYIFLGISHSIISQTLPYDSISSTLLQTTPMGGVSFNFGGSFHLSANANYVLGNYNQGDYQIVGALTQYLGNKFKNIGFLQFGLDLIAKTPNWYYNNYQSNYYRWNNNLNKENYLILSGSYNYKQLKVGAKFFTVANYTYLDDSIRPKQIVKGETILQIAAEGTIPINKFGINTRIVYQTTSQPNIIRFPKITGIADLYFRGSIFSNAATIQTGFQFTYFTEYYADAYMPELRLFYLQNNQQIGNYLYIDFYLTLMVKRARLFFKAAHFNSYFGDYRYYSAPNYPSRDAQFYFGISWRFHN